MKKMWIDTETTGLNEKTDQIIELSAFYGKASFHAYCIPQEKPANFDFISNLTGITWEKLQKEGVREWHLYQTFAQWLDTVIDKFDKNDKAVFSGYNPNFDDKFLRELFSKNNNKFYGSYFLSVRVDVQTLVAEAFAEGKIPMLENFKLATVCEHFGIKLKAHSATDDVLAAMTLYKKLKTLRKARVNKSTK